MLCVCFFLVWYDKLLFSVCYVRIKSRSKLNGEDSVHWPVVRHPHVEDAVVRDTKHIGISVWQNFTLVNYAIRVRRCSLLRRGIERVPTEIVFVRWSANEEHIDFKLDLEQL